MDPGQTTVRRRNDETPRVFILETDSIADRRLVIRGVFGLESGLDGIIEYGPSRSAHREDPSTSIGFLKSNGRQGSVARDFRYSPEDGGLQ